LEAARRGFYEDNLSAPESIGLGLEALILEYGDFQCPPESAKSLERTLGALEFYFANYPLSHEGHGARPRIFPGGKRGIEFTFAQPLSILHPVTHQPILYTGRADMIADFAGGTYVYDDKTASSLGPSWARQWELRSQFTGYCWAAKELGIPVAGVLVRGVSILKTKFETQQSITYRSQFEIDRWLEQVHRDIERMIRCWEEGYWDYSLDHACTEYGGCSLAQVCKSSDPNGWLDLYFQRKVWDPLLREEVSVEEYEARNANG
jgi:hypothetical protein